MGTYVQPKHVAVVTCTIKVVLYFCSFLIQGSVFSLMMGTYVQPKRVAVFTCTIKAV